MVEYNMVELETYRGLNEKLYEGIVHNDEVDTKDDPVDAMVFKQGTFFLNVSAFEAQKVVGETISFVTDGSKIKDSGNGLAGFKDGDMIEITGSGEGNDGIYTVVTGGVAAEIVVFESLTDEEAGAEITIEEVDVKLPAADTIEFVASGKLITDSGDGLEDFETGDKIRVTGSRRNDGIYTIATGGVDHEIVVSENLSNENPDATVSAQATIAFFQSTKKITDSGNGLAGFLAGDVITVSGSSSNDGTYTVVTGGVAGEIVVAEALVNESASAEVTIVVVPAEVTIQTVKTLDVSIVTQDPVSGEWLELVAFTQVVGEPSTEKQDIAANLGDKLAIIVMPSESGPEQASLTVGAVFQIM